MVKLLTTQEVASMLKVHPGTVSRWLHQGHLRGIKIGPGGLWRVRSDVLQNFILQNQTPGRAKRGE